MLSTEKLTPAMRQYFEVKNNNKDAIIFFRMGDFYEMFFEDAEVASKILNITLTSRDKKKEIPMCGFPYHAAKGYISKLIDAGLKVAVCEQVTDPSESGGLVERAVVEIITPGVKTSEDLLDSGENNFIASITVGGSKNPLFGFSYMDVSTGEFYISEFDSMEALNEELSRIVPAEVLIKDEEVELVHNSFNITELDSRYFDKTSTKETLLNHFNTTSMDGFGCANLDVGLVSSGVLLRYVADNRKADLSHIKILKPYSNNKNLIIDDASRKNLELLYNNTTKEKAGSLLGVMDKTKTAMGARLMRYWLLSPLVDVKSIENRINAVETFIDNSEDRIDCTTYLKSISDIERLIGRVAMSVANPRDIVSLKDSLNLIPQLKKIIAPHNKGLLKTLNENLDEVEEAVILIDKALVDSPSVSIKDGGYIREGYNSELDEIRELGNTGKDFLAQLEIREKEKTGINTLKVRFNKVFGYYIEVSKLDSKNVPYEYTRKQTLVNAERYITPELKEWETKILSAEEKIISLEQSLLRDLITNLCQYIERVQTTSRSIATLDCLLSFADLGVEYNYSKPIVNDGTTIDIKGGRHPVIESMIREDFIPNDLTLNSKEEQIVILTGPNMAGKSTYIRQTALITLMAQAGSFVPAESATIGVVDKIFTRVGATDDLTKGHSTFMVEMIETANILNNATSKSLIILDEIGRGTSTFDGLSIAWSVVEYLHDYKDVQAKTLFATHYHELTEITITKDRVRNYSMAVNEYKENIVFLRKVVAGGASRSYGIQVGRLAGLPDSVITRAKEVLSNLEKGEFGKSGEPNIGKSGKVLPSVNKKQLNLNLVPETNPLRDELNSIDTNNITPVEALNLLNKLKDKTYNDE